MKHYRLALWLLLAASQHEHASCFSLSAPMMPLCIQRQLHVQTCAHTKGKRAHTRSILGGICLSDSSSPQEALAKAAAQMMGGGGQVEQESQLFAEVKGLGALRNIQSEWGAVVEEQVYAAPEPPMKMMKKGEDRSVLAVASFKGATTEACLQAIQGDIVVTDLSHWGVLEVRGEDRLKFLNSQCTNKMLDAKPMDCMRACFINKVGRALDLCTLVVLPDSVLILTSPSTVQLLYQTLDLLIFPKDQVTVTDVSEYVAIFACVGPKSSERTVKVLRGFQPPSDGEACMLPIGESQSEALVLSGCGLAEKGFTFIANPLAAAGLWQQLSGGGVTLAGSRAWDAAQVLDGVPRAGHELTLDYNPLEAGLWSTVSFDKGCYVGQETMARLRTYDGVKQLLWRLDLERDGMTAEDIKALEGAKIYSTATQGSGGAADGEQMEQSERSIGLVTSIYDGGEGRLVHCLCYVRTKASGEGVPVSVQVGDDKIFKGKLMVPRYSTRSDQNTV